MEIHHAAIAVHAAKEEESNFSMTKVVVCCGQDVLFINPGSAGPKRLAPISSFPPLDLDPLPQRRSSPLQLRACSPPPFPPPLLPPPSRPRSLLPFLHPSLLPTLLAAAAAVVPPRSRSLPDTHASSAFRSAIRRHAFSAASPAGLPSWTLRRSDHVGMMQIFAADLGGAPAHRGERRHECSCRRLVASIGLAGHWHAYPGSRVAGQALPLTNRFVDRLTDASESEAH